MASASANIAFAYITSSFAWFAGTTFLTVAGEALGIASIATHDDSPEASNRTSANLGWASIALGVTSVIATSGMFIWRLERMPMPAPRYRAHSVGNGQIQLRRASEVEHHDFLHVEWGGAALSLEGREQAQRVVSHQCHQDALLYLLIVLKQALSDLIVHTLMIAGFLELATRAFPLHPKK